MGRCESVIALIICIKGHSLGTTSDGKHLTWSVHQVQDYVFYIVYVA